MDTITLALPPPTEPVADAVHARLAPDETLAVVLGGDADGSPSGVPADGRVERGGSAVTSAEDRARADVNGRLAVRVSNLPDAPGYVGSPSAGDHAASGWVRVELRASATDRPGARLLCEAALARALALLLLQPLPIGADDVEAMSTPHRHAGPTPALFDPEERDWTASAVVEVLVRRLPGG